ncbi:ParB/RepB/Spo0J family partition protein [candidate division KSB1 bacterium]
MQFLNEDPAAPRMLRVPVGMCDIPESISRFTFPQSGESIRDSVGQFGIIQPVAAVPGHDHRFRIICGAKRLHAAKELGIEEIPARILEDKDLTERQRFDIAFADNVASRVLNAVEIAGALSYLKERVRLPVNTINEKYLQRIERKSGIKGAEDYCALYELDDELKRYVVSWNVSVSIAVQFLKFSRDDRSGLFGAARKLQFHGGKLKQYLLLCFEICRIQNITVGDLFAGEEFSALLQSEKITQSQKQQKVLEWLHRRRYPALTELNENFFKTVNKLDGLPPGTISPPRDFEGDKLRAQLSFRDLEELDRLIAALQESENRDIIKKLLKLF